MTVQRLDLVGRGHHPLPEDRTALVVAAVLLAILLGGSRPPTSAPPDGCSRTPHANVQRATRR